MLQTYTYNSTGFTLNTNDSVLFNIDVVDTDCRVDHQSGTTAIEIDKPGYYLITFNSFGYNTGAVVEGTPYTGTYTYQLFNNGIPIQEAVASASSTADTDIVNVYFSTILQVRPSCKAIDNNAVLTANYLGQVATGNLANLTVIKLR